MKLLLNKKQKEDYSNEIIIEFLQTDEFKKKAIQHAFNNQSLGRDEHLAKMNLSFIDSEGVKYYCYRDEEDIPLPRYEEIQIIIQEVENRISNVDLDEFVSKGEEIIFGAKYKKDADKVKNISHMFFAIKKRRELLYEPYLLFKLASALYVSEHQDPTIWDERYEETKLNRLKIDATGGLRDFFYGAGLRNYLPPSWESMKESSLLQELKNQQQQVKEFQNLLATIQL